MEKLLITGVAGFIAAHLARRFVAEGFKVVGVDDFSGGRKNNVPAGVDVVEGDLALPETIAKLPRDCRRILHFMDVLPV